MSSVAYTVLEVVDSNEHGISKYDCPLSVAVAQSDSVQNNVEADDYVIMRGHEVLAHYPPLDFVDAEFMLNWFTGMKEQSE